MKRIQAVYLGERLIDRLIAKNEIRHCFRTEKGEEVFYTGLRGFLYFGDVFWLKVGAKGSLTTLSKPEPVETPKPKMVPTDREKQLREAHKILIQNERSGRRKLVDQKRLHGDILRAVNLLRPFFRGLSHFEQRKFIETISDLATRKVKR